MKGILNKQTECAECGATITYRESAYGMCRCCAAIHEREQERKAEREQEERND